MFDLICIQSDRHNISSDTSFATVNDIDRLFINK